MSAAYLIAYGGKLPEPRTSEILRAFYQSLLDPLMAEATACGWEGCAFSSVKMAGERVKIEIVPGDGVLTVDGMRAFQEAAAQGARGRGKAGGVMAEHTSEDEQMNCPICDEQFQIGDLCATDIELGTCHAACLKGSAVVDLDTGDEVYADAHTFCYGGDA